MRIDPPQPGYYLCRLVNAGPWIPIKFLEDADPETGEVTIACLAGGLVRKDVQNIWSRCAAHPICFDEYKLRMCETSTRRSEGIKDDEPVDWSKV